MFTFSEIPFKLCALFTADSKSKCVKQVRNSQRIKRKAGVYDAKERKRTKLTARFDTSIR